MALAVFTGQGDAGPERAGTPGVRAVSASDGPSLVGTLRAPKAPGQTLSLYLIRDGRRVEPAQAVALIGAAGSFRFWSLEPGRYELVASGGARRVVDLASGQATLTLR